MPAIERAKHPDSTVVCTDGSGNTRDRIGAWAFVVYDKHGVLVGEFSQAVVDTTNNLMELEAVIQALTSLSDDPLHIVSDSRYVIDGITSWIFGWRQRNWMTRDEKPVANRASWQRLWTLLEKRLVTFEHVRGHRGHPGNELADQLCTAAVKKKREALSCKPFRLISSS